MKRDISAFFKPQVKSPKKGRVDETSALVSASSSSSSSSSSASTPSSAPDAAQSPESRAEANRLAALAKLEGKGSATAYVPSLPPSWRALEAELTKPYFKSLDSFLVAEAARGKQIYPPRAEIFAALSVCALDDVKVMLFLLYTFVED